MEVVPPNLPKLRKSWGPYELRPSPRAILRLSLGSAAAIATALSIPDAFSLLPSSPSMMAWALRLGGLWLYAYLLWATGLMCILHTARIFGGGILLTVDGIKLGKIGKVIEWKSVEAIFIEERKVFSRIFAIPAQEMKIHIVKPDGKRAVKSIASFQYMPQQFFSLFYYVCRLGTGAKPSSFRVCVFRDSNSPQLRKIGEQGRIKRVALTAFIACSLLIFLGRKSTVNYFFNLGNKESNLLNLEKAAQYYGMATDIDFTFAPAWDGLARTEMRLGDVESARSHWQKSLQMKPDFVESKLGLSTIYMMEGDIEKADELIAKANKLAPFDESGYINRAEINSLQGDNRGAIALLLPFVKQKRGRDQAVCLLARCYIKDGDYLKASELLSSSKTMEQNPCSRIFYRTVCAELALAEKRVLDAKRILESIGPAANRNPDLLLDLARLKILERDYGVAENYINRASAINKSNPWILIERARIAFARKDIKTANAYIKKCADWKYLDPCLLASVAQYFLETSYWKAAAQNAFASQELDKENKLADAVLKAVVRQSSSIELPLKAVEDGEAAGKETVENVK